MILCLFAADHIQTKKILEGTSPKNKQLYIITSDDGVKYDFSFLLFIFLF